MFPQATTLTAAPFGAPELRGNDGVQNQPDGTSPVGTKDHGACCVAAEPGVENSCKADPSADVMPKPIAKTRSAAPNKFQAAIAVV
jgi:hypothetical protein